MNLNRIGHVSGLSPKEEQMFFELLQIWSAKLARNRLRYSYYSYKNKLQSMGISIPPQFDKFETVIGWPAKAVDSLAMRTRFEGFVFDGIADETAHKIVTGNRLQILHKQAARSALVGSCAFLTTSKGGDGEPPAVINAYSNLFAAAKWNRRRKRIECGLTVVDTKTVPWSDEEVPTWVNMYTSEATIEIKETYKGWTARHVPHKLGRPAMEAIVFRPSLDRPFGRSRISRAVMSITDCAMREALRTEVGAEFYTAPQKYILGADDSLFENDSKWDAYIGSFLALSRDEDGELPTVGMFSQGTMQPHTEYMRSLAARFSGETSIPISELGVVHDNPASAEAIYAAKESLVCEAQDFNDDNTAAMANVGMMALSIANNISLDMLDENQRSIMPRFKNPALPSVVSQADAIVKLASIFPWLSESDVALEEVGFADDQIRRLKSDKVKAEVNAILNNQLMQQQPAQTTQEYIEVLDDGDDTTGDAQ